MAQIKKVLGKTGLLIYLQDAVPASSNVAFTSSGLPIGLDKRRVPTALDYVKSLHQIFSKQLVSGLEEHGFDYAEVAASGHVRITKSNAFQPPFKYPRGANSFGYIYGVAGHAIRGVPKGKIDLDYQGIAYLATMNHGHIPAKIEPALKKFGVIK